MDLVANLQGPHRADLELPLPWHHLSIDARDDEACLHTQPHCIMSSSAPPVGGNTGAHWGGGGGGKGGGGGGGGMGQTERQGAKEGQH